jgi:hypothetical protein
MQRSRHAVRYYIDRNHNDDGTEVRSVPVTIVAAERPEQARQDAASPRGDEPAVPAPSRRTKSAHVSTLVRSAVRRAPRRGR